MSRDGLDQLRASINVTPLVDVLLVLLIIFIMVAPIMAKAVRSDIPQKATGPLPAEYAARQLVLHISSDGRLRLNQEELAQPDLPARLNEIYALRGGERLIFLDADERIPYGTVIAVMDLCRDAGVQTIGVIPDSIGAR